MNIVLIRFGLRKGTKRSIPWHYSFYKDILTADGHSVDIVDNQIENHTIKELVDFVITNKYQLVGTGGIGTVYNSLKRFCSLLKKRNPYTQIVVGGQIVADYEFIFEKIPIDIAVLGEGEVTLKKIVDAIDNDIELSSISGIVFKNKNKLIRTRSEKLIHLDSLPDYNFKNINLQAYNTNVPENFIVNHKARRLKSKGNKYLNIFLARGCPHNCIFCYRHIKGYRTFGYERLEEILCRLKNKGFSFFSYGDECITANRNNLCNICELSIKYDLFWMTSGRINHVTEDIMNMLKKSNCIGLQFGVESFDQDMLDAMKKNTTCEQNIKVMNWCYQYGLHTVLQLVIGIPGEDRKTLYNTRKGMWKCYFKADRIACAILNPYPGSPAYYFGIKNGYIKDKEFLHQEVAGKTKIVVNFSKLSNRELYAWQQWIICEATLSFRIKHNRLSLNRNLFSRFAHFVIAYLKLFYEPLNFLMFNVYLFKGLTFWLKPLKKLKWGEL
jgi:radical SAM superfamily enzyme YgiQ (UPF0313 family)|tara:strand:- start:313 stop:1803 length:1491 start_codon:yes stop_codon:yes gene_type:complete